jgi:transcriptional regulator with XRE-family HTH domain
MSPEQCRAARAWLGWSQQELARRSHVGLSTVKDFERGDRRPMANNLDAMRRAIEASGVNLVFGEDGQSIGIVSAAPLRTTHEKTADQKRDEEQAKGGTENGD